MGESWKEIGWNGIYFRAPVDWQLAQIGARHLVLEDETAPVMEVKWSRIKGNFSHQAHLKRLTSLQKKQVRKTFKVESIPADWEKVLMNFNVSGFSWQGDATCGQGVILFCPSCRNATLVQFFHKKSVENIRISSHILESFRDHRPDGQVLWAAYDIRALVPETYQLNRHRFEAGKYELDFADGSQRICLHRWALASVLLAEQDLVQLAKTVAGFNKPEPVAGRTDGCDMAEWSSAPKSDWQRWLGRFKHKSSYYWLGLWHLEEKNRILGVRAEGKKPLDPELLDRICSHYESV
jgi:hypothetical protein